MQFLSCVGICFVVWMLRTFGTKCAWINRADPESALSICRSVLISDGTGIRSQFPTREGNDSLKLSVPQLISVLVSFSAKLLLKGNAFGICLEIQI